MKFRFKLVAVLIIALLVIGIYNLGAKNNEEAEEEEKQSYYQTETVYLWYSDETFTDYFTSAAVAFHEKNPDVRVIPQLVAPDEYIEYINSASVSAENFPDLYVLTNDALEKDCRRLIAGIRGILGSSAVQSASEEEPEVTEFLPEDGETEDVIEFVPDDREEE